MASAKLVKVHAQHHRHNDHISRSRQHDDVVSREKSPSPFPRACPSPFLRHPQSPVMTLDYSLPRGRDLETGSPPQHGLQSESDPHAVNHRHNSDYSNDFLKKVKGHNLDPQSRSEPLTLRDEAARDDPYLSPPPSSHSQTGEDNDAFADSPTKKNKRKLSSPRRRLDISDDEAPVQHKESTKRKKKHLESKRPASPMGEDDDSGIDSYKSVDDAILDVVGGSGSSALTGSPSLERINKMTTSERNGSGSERRNTASSDVLVVPSSPFSSSLSSLKRTPVSSASSKTKPRKKSSLSSRNRSPSSHNSSSRHSTQHSNSQSHHTDTDTQPKDSPPSPHDPRLHPPNLPPNFLHPMFTTAGVTPAAAALGLVPGLYFGHPGLHPSLPVLPPHLQQAYVAAAAAAAAQASALSSSTSSTATATSSSSSQPPSTAASTSSTLPAHHNYYATPSPLPPSMLPSMLYAGVVPRSETASSEPRGKQQQQRQPSGDAVDKHSSTKSSAQSSQSQRHQRQSSSSTSSSPQLLHQSKTSPGPSQPSTSSFPPTLLFDPSSHGSNNSSSSNKPVHIPPELFSGPSTSGFGEDPNDSSSSRPQSPEDLTMPGGSRGSRMSRKHRKNYKNMTRERRVEANARERTRVHTISAAFEALRRAVPSYSHNQKLSKLAILRIACSYIMSLARLGDMDYTSASEHIGQPLDFSECVDMTTNTIQTEGRARRRH